METVELIIAAVGGGSGSFAIGQAVTKWRLNKLEESHEKAEQEIKERFVGISAAKKATVTDINRRLDKEVETIHKRIDSVKDEAKEYEKKTANEFKEINDKLNNLNIGLSEINGKLDIILKK